VVPSNDFCSTTSALPPTTYIQYTLRARGVLVSAAKLDPVGQSMGVNISKRHRRSQGKVGKPPPTSQKTRSQQLRQRLLLSPKTAMFVACTSQEYGNVNMNIIVGYRLCSRLRRHANPHNNTEDTIILSWKMS
jgi:hypothetical protein